MVLYVWNQTVTPGKVPEFEALNDPGGEQEAFFRQGAGFLGIQLLRDEIGLNQLSFNSWDEKNMFEAFIENPLFEEEFKRLCYANRQVTEKSQELGWFSLPQSSWSHVIGAPENLLYSISLVHPKEGKEGELEQLVKPLGKAYQLLKSDTERFKGTTILTDGAGTYLIQQIWNHLGQNGKPTYEVPTVYQAIQHQVHILCEEDILELGTFTEVLSN